MVTCLPESADHILAGCEDGIIFDDRVPFDNDLGNERLVTRGRHDEVDVRRPIRISNSPM